MKQFLTFFTLFCTSLFFGQKTKEPNSAMFFDAVLMPLNMLEYIEKSEIKSVTVVKKDTTINGLSYQGQLYITSKNPKKYDFISLEQIKDNFTKIKNNDVIYMINGAFIKDNITTFKLDRNYILEVEVTNAEAFYNLRKSDTKFDIINILGKTKKNLEKQNKFILSGQEVIGVK